MQLTLPGPVDRQPLAQIDAPSPVPGAGDIRLRVRACGVCHTDLHIVEGDIPPARLPIVPGHQVVGAVDFGASAHIAIQVAGIDLSAGASIVLTCTVLFLLALVFSPRDGMLARLRPERRSG